jgi:hypothetical protein
MATRNQQRILYVISALGAEREPTSSTSSLS